MGLHFKYNRALLPPDMRVRRIRRSPEYLHVLLLQWTDELRGMKRPRASLADDIADLLNPQPVEPGEDADLGGDDSQGSLLAPGDSQPMVRSSNRRMRADIDLHEAGEKYAGRVVSRKKLEQRAKLRMRVGVEQEHDDDDSGDGIESDEGKGEGEGEDEDEGEEEEDEENEGPAGSDEGSWDGGEVGEGDQSEEEEDGRMSHGGEDGGLYDKWQEMQARAPRTLKYNSSSPSDPERDCYAGRGGAANFEAT